MKKLYILLLLSFISVAVFGTEVYNSGTSNNGNDAFVIYGYYNPSAIDKVITLKIKLPDSVTTVANTGSITWNKPESGYEDVFTWEATGTFEGKVSIEFTITPLQAKLFDFYFIPAHSFKSSLGNNPGHTIATNSNSNHFTFDSDTNSYVASYSLDQEPSFQSNMAKTITYTETIEHLESDSWTLTGSFALNVTQYNELFGGTFDY